jgi:hypothetical protein
MKAGEEDAPRQHKAMEKIMDKQNMIQAIVVLVAIAAVVFVAVDQTLPADPVCQHPNRPYRHLVCVDPESQTAKQPSSLWQLSISGLPIKDG